MQDLYSADPTQESRHALVGLTDYTAPARQQDEP